MAVFDDLNVNEMSSVEQEIYRFLVNNLDKIPYMRVREIADDAHVSSTSVFRFVQKIGFRSFPEFRFYIKAHLDNVYQNENRQHIGIEERVNSLNMGIFHPDVEYQIKNMALTLQDSDFVLVMGMGASGAIAQYTARKLASLGYFSVSLDDLTYPIHSFLRTDQKNVILFLSVSGETKELIEVISGLKNKNSVKKFCITLNKKSTLGKLCDYSIEYEIKEERKDIFFDLTSQLPSLAILETLISYLKDFRKENK